MTEFIRDKAGNTEAQQKKALAFLFAQASTGLATTGVLSGLQVTQTGTASANVLVGAGAGVSQDTVGNGASELVNDTQKTLDVLTANPMGATPRDDIVVFDSATTSIRVIVGTPNAVPTDPTVPTTAIPLARLRHAASATTVPTAKIDDLRVFTTLFGVDGLLAAVTPGSWTTLTITAGSGWSVTAGYTPQARLLPGNRVEIIGAVTAGASISNNTVFTLPSGMRPASNRFIAGHNSSGGASSISYNMYVQTDGSVKIDPVYAEGGALTASVAYPVSGVFPI